MVVSFFAFNHESVMVHRDRMTTSVAYHMLWGKEIVIASEKLNRRK